jgi:hypothetical protein
LRWLSLLAIAMSFGIATFLWWLTLIRSARRVMPQLTKRAVAIGIGVPLLWLICALVFLILLPVSVLFVIVIFSSLS